MTEDDQAKPGDLVVAALEDMRRTIIRTVLIDTVVVSVVSSFTSALVAVIVWT